LQIYPGVEAEPRARRSRDAGQPEVDRPRSIQDGRSPQGGS